MQKERVNDVCKKINQIFFKKNGFFQEERGFTEVLQPQIRFTVNNYVVNVAMKKYILRTRLIYHLVRLQYLKLKH